LPIGVEPGSREPGPGHGCRCVGAEEGSWPGGVVCCCSSVPGCCGQRGPCLEDRRKVEQDVVIQARGAPCSSNSWKRASGQLFWLPSASTWGPSPRPLWWGISTATTSQTSPSPTRGVAP